MLRNFIPPFNRRRVFGPVAIPTTSGPSHDLSIDRSFLARPLSCAPSPNLSQWERRRARGSDTLSFYYIFLALLLIPFLKVLLKDRSSLTQGAFLKLITLENKRGARNTSQEPN
jgi:hypothetical protein